MEPFKLYMVMLGCKPTGRFTEQHDIFFGIGKSLKDLVPQMKVFWKDSGELHIDAWREVSNVDNYQIEVVDANSETDNDNKLFFLNLGGYRENEFEEYHYKVLAVADAMLEAIKRSKKTAFYKHFATSHIDDKYGIDIDDVYKVHDILPAEIKSRFRLRITPSEGPDDKLHIGYLKLSKI